jgi:hypothetical protein
VRAVAFLTGARLRDLSEAAAEPSSGGMLLFRPIGTTLLLSPLSDCENDDDDAQSADDDGADEADAEAMAAEDAAWEAEARAAVAAMPMAQRQRIAGGLRRFMETMRERIEARAAARAAAEAAAGVPPADVAAGGGGEGAEGGGSGGGAGAAAVTAEDVRECERALRAEWAQQPPW